MTNILNDPLFNQQWHLNNTGQSGGTPGADINLSNTWDSFTGQNVVVGVIDDAFQYSHPDLNNQYRADLSYDFVDDDSDSNASGGIGLLSDGHGTAVAGIIAADGNNDVGVSGVAPNASFAGLKIDFVQGHTDSERADALSYQNQEIDIYNASWGRNPDSPLYSQGPATTDAIETSILEGRGGLGNIYVFAAGNNGDNGGNVNYDSLTNSRYTIAVGSIDHNGVHSSFSNPGASLLISAYSAGDDEGLTTTDLLGDDGYNFSTSTDLDLDYTEIFVGTSAAAPIVSGVVALMLEANPDLTWRDVQHILVETAEKNDAEDGDWSANGAGYQVNHKYGFGSIDATAAVETAQTWETVGSEVSASSNLVEVDALIPDNNPEGLTSTVDFSEDIEIEWVEVIADPDLIRSDLDLVLTSPDGTESILSQQNSESSNEDQWTFTSARHWGESSAGEWSFSVIDREESSFELTWDSSWQINVYGTSLNSDSDSDNASDISGSDGTTVYRFFRTDTQTQFYTTTDTEREFILENLPQYELEGISFSGVDAPEEGVDPLTGTSPVYRFFNTSTGIHLYTADESERAFVEENLDNYEAEGTPYYGYDTQVEGTVPLYRFYNSELDAHFYTPSVEERDLFIDSPDYQLEGGGDGIAFYVEPAQEI